MSSQNGVSEAGQGYTVFKSLVDNATDGIVQTNLEGAVVYANQAFIDMMGYDAVDDVRGKPVIEFFHASEYRSVQEAIIPQVQQFGRWSGISLNQRSDGSTFFALGNAFLMKDDSGIPLGMGAVIRDITEERDQRELLEQVINAVPSMLLVKDQDGIFKMVNRQAAEACGSTPEEMIGKSDYDFSPAEQADYFTQQDQDVIDKKETLYIPEEMITRASGEKRYYQTIKVPLMSSDGGVNHVLIVSTDIHDRKMAEAHSAALQAQQTVGEERFSNIVNSIPIGMHMYDLNEVGELIFTQANAAADRIIGIDHAPLYGKPIEEAFPPLTETEIPERYHAAARDGVVWQTEQVTYDSDGIQGAFEVYAFQSSPGSMVAAFVDITERKKSAEEQKRLQEEVIDAQRRALQDLSTPIIPLFDGVLIMPLIGSIDTSRARDIMRNLLAGISEHRAKTVIVDITGVPVVDSGVADHLNKTIQAARLKGATTIISGISDAVAETIVDLGIDWNDIETVRDLQSGLSLAMQRAGITTY